MLLSFSVYWANHWAHRKRCGGSVKGVEAGLVEAGRAAPSLEACTGCPSPDAVWVSVELYPGPPLPWYQCQGLCLRATGLVTHLVSHTDTLLVFARPLVPEQLGCVSWGGKRLAKAGEEVLCHPGRLAYGRSRARVLWPKYFVFLFRCFLHILLG